MQNNILIVSKVVVLNPEGEILILRRSATAPRRPGTWDLPGGQLETNEDPAEAASREAHEEAGITVKNQKALTIYSQDIGGQFILTTVFKAELDSGDITLSYEHDDYKWITREAFEGLDIPEKYKIAVRDL